MVDETADDFGEKFWRKLFGFATDAVSTKIIHNYSSSNCFWITLIVNMMSSTVLPRERSAMGVTKP